MDSIRPSPESDTPRKADRRNDPLTLASLRKVSNYPVYVLRYHGDYGFAEYLKTGERRERPSAIAAASADPAAAWACTCFAALGDPNKPMLGRNFDWFDDVPLVLLTKPKGGFASVSVVDLRYFGFDRNHLPDEAKDKQRLLETPFAPFDGMNEKGVAVGMMAVPRSEPPFDPARVTVGDLEVIRLILDRAATLDEAVELMGTVNVKVEDPPIHYLVMDSSGRSAVIEFVGGKLIRLPNSESWQVSTNFILHGSDAPRAAPCWRFNRANGALSKLGGAPSIPQALGILESVSQQNTIWSTLYGPANGEIRLVPGKRFGEVLLFNLREMTKDLRHP
jgi:choloylglycine hydrolase